MYIICMNSFHDLIVVQYLQYLALNVAVRRSFRFVCIHRFKSNVCGARVRQFQHRVKNSTPGLSILLLLLLLYAVLILWKYYTWPNVYFSDSTVFIYRLLLTIVDTAVVFFLFLLLLFSYVGSIKIALQSGITQNKNTNT